MVELVGFEPTTSWMQARRSPARATTPYSLYILYQKIFKKSIFMVGEVGFEPTQPEATDFGAKP